MTRIFTSMEQMIGNTPMLELTHFEETYGLKARLLAKVEFLNPTGSIKDRAALSMIDDAEEKGLLKKGSVIIEPTSGNTGIGLAAIGAARGYRVIIVMPDTMSAERIKMMQAYGAEAVLTDGTKGMAGAIAKAEELNRQIEGSIIAGQFVNPANSLAHYKTTGPEIMEQTDGEVNVLVAGVGTGGTITGTGQYLKEKKPSVEIVAVEPDTSAVLSGEKGGPHGLQGIGAGFIPDVLDTSVIDTVIRVKDEEALRTGAELGRKEGIICGISAGAALYAALTLAQKEEYEGKTIVVILPDSGDRYLSTPMFGD
ncbi:MAG: cysteine synthase A [Solobacterium sp.]|nr:cysteine synthase A [Solobacterium sp.]